LKRYVKPRQRKPPSSSGSRKRVCERMGSEKYGQDNQAYAKAAPFRVSNKIKCCIRHPIGIIYPVNYYIVP
jgi:hypothetical protein